MYIPKGFNTIAPYFVVDDANIFVSFLKKAFGGIEVGRTEIEGRTVNVQVRIGDSTIMAADSTDEVKQTFGAYYLYVEDAEESMKKALASGGKLLMEVSDMPYGDRQGGVEDPFGNSWWVSQRLVDEPYH